MLEALHQWIEERHLDAAAVLTSFKERSESSGKSKDRRELLLQVTRSSLTAVADQLQLDKTLDLKKWKAEVPDAITRSQDMIRVWRQGNADATRKRVAPTFHAIFESFQAGLA